MSQSPTHSSDIEAPDLDWRDGGIPVSRLFDDPYFSLQDGLAETQHVFLDGNDLPARFRSGFQIAELGFGTGLNLLAAWLAWEASDVPGPLRFTSFELYPMDISDMREALAGFDLPGDKVSRLLEGLAQTPTAFSCETLEFEMITGDARTCLPLWPCKADAWFLDGFSPAKNPELWGAELMHDVGRHTAPDGTAATYTAAGQVRRALQDAGFDVTRVPGFGRKRHMTVARKLDIGQ